MATYVNDLRLKEIATGDEAGTWGTSTNTNLELIAEAFSYGTEASFGSDADATTTIADGSTDPVRSLYLKVTSGASLTATRTLTIAPNTVSKVWIIENATTGSQSINISQGSGANVTIPNGDVKVVYSDGAGSGAAVVDAFANLKVTDPAQTNITSLGTLSTLTVDDITINGSTISDAADLTVDVGGDIILDADGGNVTFKDAGTSIGDFSNSSSDFVITSSVQDKDILFKGDDGGSPITALQLDMSAAGAATFNGAVTADAGVSIDNITIDGTEIDLSSGSLTIDVASDLILDVGNDTIELRDSGTKFGEFISSSTDFVIKSSVSDKDIIFKGNDGGSAITAMTIDMSEGGDISIPSGDLFVGAGISYNASAASTFHIGATNRTSVNNTDLFGYLINVSGDATGQDLFIKAKRNIDGSSEDERAVFQYDASAESQIFSTANSEAMRIDSSGNIGIGTSSPSTLIEGRTTTANTAYLTLGTDNAGSSHTVDHDIAALQFYSGDTSGAGSGVKGSIRYKYGSSSGATTHMTFHTAGVSSGNDTERMRIDSNGGVVIGDTSIDQYTNLKVYEEHFGGMVNIGHSNTGGTFPKVSAIGMGSDGVSFGHSTNNGTVSLAGSAQIAAIQSASSGAVTDMAFYTTTGGSVAERMRIDSAGNVAIGLTSASKPLHIYSASDTAIRLQNSTTGTGTNDGLLLEQSGSDSLLVNYEAGNIRFNTNGSERMRIDSSGNLGLGTTSPDSDTRLHVVSSGATASSHIQAGTVATFERSQSTAGAYLAIIGANNGVSALHLGDSDDDDVGNITYNHSSNFMSFDTGTTERMRLDSSGDLQLGSSIGNSDYDGSINAVANKGTGAVIKTRNGDGNKHMMLIGDSNIEYGSLGLSASVGSADTVLQGENNVRINTGSANERMRIDSSGNAYFNRTSSSFNNDGLLVGNSTGAYLYVERSVAGNSILYLHRRANDGSLIDFYQGNTLEGNVSVSGTTVSYNGFCGTHDSSGTGVSSSTQVGTVLSTIDAEHKTDHAKVKVSDTEGDARVYGVLQGYKEEETNNDTGNTSVEHAVVASVGIGSVLVTGACNGGDLLESNGDGTAKVQSDDIIRSKTIGKVTIGNSDAGVKLVSCVLYCG